LMRRSAPSPGRNKPRLCGLQGSSLTKLIVRYRRKSTLEVTSTAESGCTRTSAKR
jgi:hypothetical protein